MTITVGTHLISQIGLQIPVVKRPVVKKHECEIYAKKYMKCIETCYFNWGHEIDCKTIQNKYNTCISAKKS